MRRLFVEDDCKVSAREGREREEREERERGFLCRQLIGKQDVAATPSHVRENRTKRKKEREREREKERERLSTGLV
jgi:hypothetical protein